MRPSVMTNVRGVTDRRDGDNDGVSFVQDDRGAITMFIVVIFVILAVMAGMAIDIARHETARADLQNALDRGVLAAANSASGVASKADAERIIGEYMASRTNRESTFKLTVDAPLGSGLTGRTISASLDAVVGTTFLQAMGVTELDLPAAAGAAESRGLTEIVLVLDVSGSMGESSTFSNGSKLDDLKLAVNQFVDTVMTSANQDRVMISVVPYSAQVALTPAMAANYVWDNKHAYSYCLDYEAIDFTTPVISTTATLSQSQHFPDSVQVQWAGQNTFFTNTGQATNWNCPSVNNAILPFETNAQAVKDHVAAMTSQNWTASDVGMKWASHLLDPGSRPILQTKYAGQAQATTYANWPNPWTATNVNKIVVLMSDGVNTLQEKVDEDLYNFYGPEWFVQQQNWDDFWFPGAFDLANFRYRYIDNSGDNLTAADNIDINGDGVADDCGQRLGQDFFFRFRNVNYRADVQCGQADFQLMEMCSTIKDTTNHGARIYTIGFELQRGSTDSFNFGEINEAYEARKAETVLMNCASSLSQHYNVDGADISQAFQNIGTELRLLRLIN
ncbi:MAG: pilus assembly protein TadG-related protein [Pseudomonadota bacterium]